MKYTKYLIALFSAIFFAACTAELLDQPSSGPNDMIQLVSRVIPFSDCDVETRANKNDNEVKINHLDYFIFDLDHKCIFHQGANNTDPLLIDKSLDTFNDDKFKNCYIVSIANGPDFNIELMTTTFSDIESQSIDVAGVSIPSNGLPMVGRYPETGTFNLIDTEQGSVLTIPVKSLFSKIVVNISVDSEEIIPGDNQPLPSFTLIGATAYNVASEVDFIGGEESEEGLVDGTDDATTVLSGGYTIDGATGKTVDGGTALSFSFYLPERFLQAGTSATEFGYPFGTGTSIREEDKAYRQRYKPLLAMGYEAYNSEYNESSDKKATYVRLEGEFSNHQGHLFGVSYDIYVGKDNYGNFDIVRNRQYNNNIVIKGIHNSNNESGDIGSISIDHRVDVERGSPIIISLRRETLLDSHFEVRPMLIRLNGAYPNLDNIEANAKVKVEIEYYEEPEENWIGLERSFGNGTTVTESTTYLVDGELTDANKNIAGKRKYFTTDLTTTTLASTEVKVDADGLSTSGGRTIIIPMPKMNQDQRVWIYIDECSTAGDNVRSARIKVSYSIDGDTYINPVEYVLNQRMLFPVTYNDHTYNIEYHEEYLYNYDSYDQYGQTEYEGMEWGLENLQLSHKYKAFFVEGSIADDFINYYINSANLYYDFYLTRDINKTSATRRDKSGWAFSKEIIDYLEQEFTPIDLATNPRSAIEYCYNKNKRNPNTGEVEEINWYLPAIDEIENIMMGAYTDFIVFQDKYYWSSQPSFYRGFGIYESFILARSTGDYYYDDKTSARATKIKYIGNDQYENITSGVDGYQQIMDLYIPAWDMTDPKPAVFEEVTHDSYNYWSQRWRLYTIEKKTDKTNHPGNILRTTKARIRCVYNPSPTNQ